MAKKRRSYYSPIHKSPAIDQPSFNYNLERSSAENTGKTESGGSDNERAGGKKYQTQGILDDMDEDMDTQEYKDGTNLGKAQYKDDLVADLAKLNQKKNMGYRERLYSSSGVIIEGVDPSLKDKIVKKQLGEE